MSVRKLDLSVALKLAFVEDSLAKVEEYRTQLHQNAQRVKEEIHEVVDRHVGSLRMRERQLVRQVEVVTAHEACRLSTQQASLMHRRGALSATSNLLLHCSDPEDSNTLSKINFDEMFYTEGVQPAKHVSVQLEDSGLASAVSQFGSVQLPDTITHQPSPVIPVKVEEYDDEEHDVLHKSVASTVSEAGSGSGPMHITVQFPRLNNHNSGWLFRQHTTDTTTTTAAAANADGSNIPFEPQATHQHNPNDVAAWLGDLRLSSMSARDDESSPFHCSDGFDMVGTPATSEGSSIEIVPYPQNDLSSESSEVYEIENIHHLVNDKSRWLSTKSLPDDASKTAETLDVAEACQANETCRSFEDCLCQNMCKENAREKLQQTAAFRAKTSRKRTFSEAEEGIQGVLAHMANILSSENSQWLLTKDRSDTLVSPRPTKCVMYSPPRGQWLINGYTSDIGSFSRTQVPSTSNNWLLKNLKNQKNTQEKDENEGENEAFTTEEDSRISPEALSEILSRVSVDPTRNEEGISFDGSYSKAYSCLPSITTRDQSWLLPRNFTSEREIYSYMDNRWKDGMEEDDTASKHLWQFSPASFSAGNESVHGPSKVESLTSFHIDSGSSWLLH